MESQQIRLMHYFHLPSASISETPRRHHTPTIRPSAGHESLVPRAKPWSRSLPESPGIYPAPTLCFPPRDSERRPWCFVSRGDHRLPQSPVSFLRPGGTAPTELPNRPEAYWPPRIPLESECLSSLSRQSR